MTQEVDREAARRVRAQQVGLFRYGLIAEALDPALSTRARGRLLSPDGPDVPAASGSVRNTSWLCPGGL